ncbi:hypothetical protein Acr_14g0005710 [Actinidia rufa]|uniref:Uncharacterized protein n=1 Tax=Actinidia rufa TaxID=165716 RepID=A0A7J0FQE0_9ERIC|nr:hypothetical protein Acr_14g0005710 [Actinidia rufa]
MSAKVSGVTFIFFPRTQLHNFSFPCSVSGSCLMFAMNSWHNVRTDSALNFAKFIQPLVGRAATSCNSPSGTLRGRKRSREDRAGGYSRFEGTGSRTFRNTLRLVARRSYQWRRQHGLGRRGQSQGREGNEDDSQAPTKGVVIREKRTREGDPLIEIGEPDASKGKEAVPPPPPKRFKSSRGAINARGRAAGGDLLHGGDVGSESMSDASVARKLLTGVVFASSLALRSQENLHEIDFQMARADSAELELVKNQNRALKAENKLAELSEEGSKPGNGVGDLKATVAELTKKLAKAKELAIEDFKTSGEFKAAVTDSAATYFSEGFEFCKRQLLHQFPNLGVDVANMAMDPSFAEEEEARKKEKIQLQKLLLMYRDFILFFKM